MLDILLLPIISGFVAQGSKLFIKSNKLKFDLSSAFSYSGMPSGHSAIVASLATIVGLKEGISSPLFAVCLIIAILTIRDALGIRQYLGQHGKIINILVRDLDEDKMLDQKYPHLLERLGHTPAQVIVGSILGFIVSVIGFYVMS